MESTKTFPDKGEYITGGKIDIKMREMKKRGKERCEKGERERDKKEMEGRKKSSRKRISEELGKKGRNES